jgi:hypothetical protein
MGEAYSLSPRLPKPSPVTIRHDEVERSFRRVARERHMTLVIMALCYTDERPYVIAASDRLLSDDISSHEGDISKVQQGDRQGRWLLGYSDDPDRFELFRAILRTLLADKVCDISEVSGALRRAYRDLRSLAIEREVLNPAQFKDLDEFKTQGPQMGDVFKDLHKQIREFNVGLSAIVAGFGSRSLGLFSVEHPGRVRSHFVGSCGAVAIGSGCYQAQFHLDACYHKRTDFASAVYRVLEAKMLADESVRSVGRETDLFVMDSPGSIKRLNRASVETVRAIWEERRRALPDLSGVLDFEEYGEGLGRFAIPQYVGQFRQIVQGPNPVS